MKQVETRKEYILSLEWPEVGSVDDRQRVLEWLRWQLPRNRFATCKCDQTPLVHWLSDQLTDFRAHTILRVQHYAAPVVGVLNSRRREDVPTEHLEDGLLLTRHDRGDLPKVPRYHDSFPAEPCRKPNHWQDYHRCFVNYGEVNLSDVLLRKVNLRAGRAENSCLLEHRLPERGDFRFDLAQSGDEPITLVFRPKTTA